MTTKEPKRALISVYNKDGIDSFAKRLRALGDEFGERDIY